MPQRLWITTPVIPLGLIGGVASVFGYLFYLQISLPNAFAPTAQWTVFEMGLELNRLTASAETSESLDDIRIRGEIYLSRVDILLESSVIETLRNLMPPGRLEWLYESAVVTSRLIDELDSADDRAVLLTHLRTDTRMIRDVMLEFLSIDREVRAKTNARERWVFLACLSALAVLLTTLLAAGILINHQLRKAGRALSAELATREGILGSVDAAILGLGAQGEVLYSNSKAVELLGPFARSGVRLGEAAAGQGGLLSELSSMLRGWQEQGAGEMHEMRKLRVEDEAGVHYYAIRKNSAAPANGESDAHTHASLILVIDDVTTEEEAALRREEYDARLNEASRILAYAEMSGGIVHEISQPLAAMRNYAYALKASMALRQASEDQRLMMDHLGMEIDRAIEVVRNIRQMGPPSLQESETCDAHEVISHSIRLVSLGCNPPPPISVAQVERPVVIAGSLPMVGQVVVNLLKNAISASSAAGRSGARVDITLVADSAEITVTDFGTGVSDDTAKSMFAPFSRSTCGGMGLGLAICQRIATNLGGSLSWENDRNAGAVFRFRVPLARQGVQH